MSKYIIKSVLALSLMILVTAGCSGGSSHSAISINGANAVIDGIVAKGLVKESNVSIYKLSEGNR